MLRVTVEIVPWGIEALTRPIGVLAIANESGFAAVSDYSVWLDRTPISRVRAHRRTDGCWPLVARASALAATKTPAAQGQGVSQAEGRLGDALESANRLRRILEDAMREVDECNHGARPCAICDARAYLVAEQPEGGKT
jgi:hypothetical protein